jgi:hypothetical protein
MVTPASSQGATARACAALEGGGLVRLSLRGMDQDVSDVQRGERITIHDAVCGAGVAIAVETRALQTPFSLTTQAANSTPQRPRRTHDVSRSPCLKTGCLRCTATASVSEHDTGDMATRAQWQGSPYRLGSLSLVIVPCGSSHVWHQHHSLHLHASLAS